MKKTLCLLGVVVALGIILTFSHTHTGEASLPERDFYNDGHYIGGLGGTIHSMR